MPEILHTFIRDGLTHLIVQANEVVVEIVIEPVLDTTGDVSGYRYWMRSTGEVYDTEEAARVAAVADVQRLSRVQGLIAIPFPGMQHAC
jgi:hypothetical protein